MRRCLYEISWLKDWLFWVTVVVPSLPEKPPCVVSEKAPKEETTKESESLIQTNVSKLQTGSSATSRKRRHENVPKTTSKGKKKAQQQSAVEQKEPVEIGTVTAAKLENTESSNSKYCFEFV